MVDHRFNGQSQPRVTETLTVAAKLTVPAKVTGTLTENLNMTVNDS